MVLNSRPLKRTSMMRFACEWMSLPKSCIENYSVKCSPARSVFKLDDVMVSSYQIEASAEQPLPADQVSFSFGRIEIAYRPQRLDGTLDTPVNAGWDVKANHKI